MRAGAGSFSLGVLVLNPRGPVRPGLGELGDFLSCLQVERTRKLAFKGKKEEERKRGEEDKALLPVLKAGLGQWARLGAGVVLRLQLEVCSVGFERIGWWLIPSAAPAETGTGPGQGRAEVSQGCGTSPER